MDRVKQKLTNCKLNAALFSDDKMGDLENSPLGAVHILRNTIWTPQTNIPTNFPGGLILIPPLGPLLSTWDSLGGGPKWRGGIPEEELKSESNGKVGRNIGLGGSKLYYVIYEQPLMVMVMVRTLKSDSLVSHWHQCVMN